MNIAVYLEADWHFVTDLDGASENDGGDLEPPRRVVVGPRTKNYGNLVKA